MRSWFDFYQDASQHCALTLVMKLRFLFLFCLAGAFFENASLLRAAAPLLPFVYETPDEFIASGDFDGDGNPDVVIADKESGKYRLGYSSTNGVFNWVDCRQTGIKGVTGFTIGDVFGNHRDALAFTSPDGTQIALADVSSATSPIRPLTVPFTDALGPSLLVAIDIPGERKATRLDFYVASIYNSPEPNLATLLRNNGAETQKLLELPLEGVATRGNRIQLNGAGTSMLWFLMSGEKGSSLQIQDLKTGKPVSLAKIEAAGSDYAFGRFGKAEKSYILTYKTGENKITARSIEGNDSKINLGESSTFNLDAPVKSVTVLNQTSGQKLFVIFGAGEKSGIFDFEGDKAPTLTQTIVSTNELITSAVGVPGGLTVFSHPPANKFSIRYLAYRETGGAYAFNVFGSLPSLADNDNITIPDIYDRISSHQKTKSEGEMKPYTNNIPGTQVTYAMVPIPGGEFVMGSPSSEAGRKPDEGPQHKVKISPFWMQQCEVTWNEYELFMYPDEERRIRATEKTDASGDKLADAVTHPSKPYVEMSFGMGKDGFPAIAMTQHAANKYCQWLSAKTGEFYRLPTEAEWEYACRAGTTTTWFFGDDQAKLKDYAWYEENSDFKYQKVGKKKPNPWGLYDIYGNVTEWVLDQYDPEFYKVSSAAGTAVDPWDKPTKPYPIAVRGGSWDDEPGLCRSAVRRGSERAWKMQDPQLPKSVWYFSDAQFVGFRIVRPLKVPSPEVMQKYWASGVERD